MEKNILSVPKKRRITFKLGLRWIIEKNDWIWRLQSIYTRGIYRFSVADGRRRLALLFAIYQIWKAIASQLADGIKSFDQNGKKDFLAPEHRWYNLFEKKQKNK